MRGLKAPPRRMRAPDSLTRSATSSTWASDSTEQGPAMTTMSLPPMTTPFTRTSDGSRRTSLLASLKGCWTGMTDSTISTASRRRRSGRPRSSPTAATMVLNSPRMTWGA